MAYVQLLGWIGFELMSYVHTPPLHLPQLTLCCVDNQYPALGFDALQKTCVGLSFAEVLFFTHADFVLPAHAIDNLRVVTHELIRNIEDYSHFMLKGLQAYVKTSHVLTIQWDGYVINPKTWQDQFLQYDYIGAPWPRKSGLWVGNGGFSLRSAKLLAALQDDAIAPMHPEDVCICDQHRGYLETEHRIQFASPELAEEFSFEFVKPHPQAFGFHGMSNFPKVMSTSELAEFIETMPDALIFNGYFQGFVFNLVKTKTKRKKLLNIFDQKVAAVLARFDSDVLLGSKVYDLIKIFTKARRLDLAKKLIIRRVAQQGWSRGNFQLALKFFLAFLLLK